MPTVEQSLAAFTAEVQHGRATAGYLGLRVELAARQQFGVGKRTLKPTLRVRPSAIVKPATASRRLTEREARLPPDHVGAIHKLSAALVKRFPGVINSIVLEINDRSGPKHVTMRVHGRRLGRAAVETVRP